MSVIKPVKDQEICVIKELPSRFLPYSVSKLQIRSLTYGEMKFLNSGGITDKELIELFSSAILNFDVNELSWSDFLFISTHSSLFTIDEQSWIIKSYCKNPKCLSPIKKKLSKNSFFEFEDLNLDGYPAIVTIKEKELHFGVITVKNHMDFMESSKDIKAPLLPLYSMAYMIKNIPHLDAYKLLQSITHPDDINLIDKLDSILYHDVKPIEITCEKCKYTDLYSVDLEVATIAPFREDERHITSRIKFGTKSQSK